MLIANFLGGLKISILVQVSIPIKELNFNMLIKIHESERDET